MLRNGEKYGFRGRVKVMVSVRYDRAYSNADWLISRRSSQDAVATHNTSSY